MTLTCKNCEHDASYHKIVDSFLVGRGECLLATCSCSYFTPTWVEARFR